MDRPSAAGPRSLRQLLHAVMTIGSDLDLPAVLTRIVEAATELADARYGALGVLDESGTSLAQFLTVGIDEEHRRAIGDLPKGHGILGLLIADPRPLRLPDLHEHPDSFGFPPGHPPMGSFLGVPIVVRGQVFGNLYLTDKRSQEVFTDVDEELVVGLAAAAAVAIDHARLHSSVSALALARDRERIAMDLHDTVIQQLFAIGLALQATTRRVPDPEVALRIQSAVDDLDATIKQIRSTIFALDVPERAGGGLRSRVVSLVDEVSPALPARPRVQFDGPVDAAASDEVAAELATALREALSNVARHAGATHVDVVVVADDLTLLLRVDDDGVGPPAERASGGRGLRNLATRAERLGGAFELRVRPGGGCRLEWRVPRP